MTLVVRWRKPVPALNLQWRGPDNRVERALVIDPASPVAAVIGPPGDAGIPGDVNNAVLDCGTFN